MRERIAVGTLESAFGTLVLAASQAGLVRLALAPAALGEVIEELSDRYDARVDEAGVEHPRRVVAEYLAGRSDSLETPVDWRIADGFTGDALRALAGVPYGTTVTYAGLAALAGNPHATRAAGTVCATNPVAIVLPCHRVLRSDGTLGNYGGGLAMKDALLRLEGVLL
jgi:methylated-DNA-[protein]-cysteine S-methyltransferase